MHAICSKQSEKKEGLPAISKALMLRSLLRTTLPAAFVPLPRIQAQPDLVLRIPRVYRDEFFFLHLFPCLILYKTCLISFHCRTWFPSTPNSLAVSETLSFRRNWRAESLNSTEYDFRRGIVPNSNNEPWEWKQACACLGLVWRAHLMCSNVWRPYGICDDSPWGTRRGWKKIKIKAQVGGGLILGIPPFVQFLPQSRGWAYTTRWANTR